MRQRHGFDSRRREAAERVRALLGNERFPRNHVVDPSGVVDPVPDHARDHARRSAFAVGAAVIVAALLTGAWVLSSRPHADPVRGDRPAAGSGSSTGAAVTSADPRGAATTRPAPTTGGSGSSALVVVDVAGKVRRPGLYRLPLGSRVDDAVRAAGGMTPGVSPAAVNLAARVTDGEQIVVGAPMPVSGAAGSSAAGPININSASLTELQNLPGVGPVLAQHILDWRTAHGSFASVDQLRSVSGIGPSKFAAMRAMVVT